MSFRMRKNAQLLRLLTKAKPEQKKAILKTLSNDQVKAVCQCVLNILHGTIGVTKKVRNRLEKHKTCLRKLGDKKVSVNHKRKILIQKGSGFLDSLLGPVLTGLASLLN